MYVLDRTEVAVVGIVKALADCAWIQNKATTAMKADWMMTDRRDMMMRSGQEVKRKMRLYCGLF